MAVAAALVATTLPAMTQTVQAATDDLLISEYVEGSSLNKAIEIYNGTGAPVDLAAGAYDVQIFFNGNTSAGATVALAGTLTDGDVFVLADDGADPAILAVADLATSNSFFNGDDAVVLRKNGVVVDAFGQVGVDPGSEWPGGGANDTLRRQADVCAGDTDETDPFDASDEWDVFGQNDFDGLGAHTANCGNGGGGDPVIVISEIMYNPASAEDDWEWVEIANTGGSTADLAGWVIDDANSVAHSAANIAAGSVPAGGSAVLYNADDVASADFTAAWGSAVNLVAVTNWSAMGLNNGGDTVGLWSDFASYSGDHQTQVNTVVSVSYDDSSPWPSDDGAGSIYLTDLAAEANDGANWALSTDGAMTPVNDAYVSAAAGGNSGADVGSPSAEPPVVDPIGECFDPATFIHEVQGPGLSSPLVGQTVTVEGVVVGDFQDGSLGANGDLNGFYVQEEDADADSDPATSEGVFVFDGFNPAVDVAVGDVVRVSGGVVEFFNETQISAETVLRCDGPVPSPTPATITLPVDSIDDFEPAEGMSIIAPQSLTIAEYFNFDRFNETVLTTDRPFQPSAIHEPGSAEADDLADLNARSRITLDDGRTTQNSVPPIHQNGDPFSVDPASYNTFRGGDLVTNATGALGYSFGLYRIQPTAGADYTVANPRPPAPEPVGGSLQVAAFNVLNYFNTVDGSGPICGPNQDEGCRGADNEDERIRQLTKIVAAIAEVDADVLGIIEVENTTGVEALADIVDGLNDLVGAGTYAYVDTGTVGSDVIKVGLIYRPGSVTPSGDFAVLDDPSFVSPVPTDTEGRNRAALAQTFRENATGATFTAVVNHLKSKSGSEIDDRGGLCESQPTYPDCDQGDGQAYFNNTRTLAAQALVDWLATDPTDSGDPDVMIIGDLNAYDKEDPIDALRNAGYADLVGDYQGEFAYTFVFSGQFGYLDYVMASGSLSPQVTGAATWHINADEPDILDYDTRFNAPEFYEPNAYRASDHDPVIAGLELSASPRNLKENARDDLAGLLPTGDPKDDRAITMAIRRIEQSLDPDLWIDDTTLDPERGAQVFTSEAQAAAQIEHLDPDDVGPALDQLIEADRALVVRQIEIAEASGASEDDLAQAQSFLGRAELLAGDGSYARSIHMFRQAWRFAVAAPPEPPVRFATFNASLNRRNAGDLAAELSAPGSSQPDVIAEIIQRTRPEVLLINEFDYDDGNVALDGFHDNYLMVPHGDAEPIEYPYRYAAPSNTGVPSGRDLDKNGSIGGPGDAFGFGFFEGQFAFAVYSMHPIDTSEIRTFQEFLWDDMPDALLPVDPATGESFYDDGDLEVFRLSSKNHADIPIEVGDRTVHFLVSHPTPPVFDGPEDRNGTRNHDEIRFWADYIRGGANSSYIYDDDGNYGGLGQGELFVIAGDQNADPFDGDSVPGAAQLLLESPKVNTSVQPNSLGGPEQAILQGADNLTHLGDPAFDTADFGESPFGPGNLRVDYVLPRNNMRITDAGVFWPLEADPLFELVGTFPFPSSDHRLVWVDVGVDS